MRLEFSDPGGSPTALVREALREWTEGEPPRAIEASVGWSSFLEE